jgi:hypothetical protein
MTGGVAMVRTACSRCIDSFSPEDIFLNNFINVTWVPKPLPLIQLTEAGTRSTLWSDMAGNLRQGTGQFHRESDRPIPLQ